MLLFPSMRMVARVLILGLGAMHHWGLSPASPAQAAENEQLAPAAANDDGDGEAAATGTLRLTFLYGGEVPVPKPIRVGMAGPCAEAALVDQRLLVNPRTKGIQNMVVYLDTGRTGTKLPPVPLRRALVQLDSRGCRFDPHVVLLQVGDVLRVTNQDPIGHNVNFSFFRNTARNLGIPAGGQAEFEIEASEPAQIPVTSNIHPWMKASVLALDHPFAGASDSSGQLEISGLPVGRELKFRIYHEFLDLETVSIGGQPVTLRRRHISRTVQPGLNNFGTVTVPQQPAPR